MRRLSIVDLATGHQPLSNEDGNVHIVYNGEIYNHQELRRELIDKGHVYKTSSDTETIVHLYEEYGHKCVEKLRGMFAFAIWDARKRELFIARDRLGIKPLYYYGNGKTLRFGSEIKTLLASAGVRPSLNRGAVAEYLAFGYLSGTETLYQDIYKLSPGHWMVFSENGDLKIERYWSIPSPEPDRSHDFAYFVRQYRERLEACVVSHLMSDVPVGVLLSGGLDSSAVAALMTRNRRDPIETFSVGYDDERFSELNPAREVAELIGSFHHEVKIDSQQFFAELPRLIWHEDEPISWPSSVALYFVAKLAREHVTVVLTGEGSDETLAGYERYAWTLWNRRFDRVYRAGMPNALRRSVREFVGDSPLLSGNLRRKLGHTFLGRDGADLTSLIYDNFYCAISAKDQGDLLTAEFRAVAGDPYGNVLVAWERTSGDEVRRLLNTDMETYLVELLMKQDQMSMAASIESRVPFLDHELVEFTATIPSEMLIKGLSGKHILKEGMADLLPHHIRHRKKMGFPTPWKHWITSSKFGPVESLLIEPRTLSRGIFREEAIRRTFAEHAAGSRDHTDRIWRLLNLELWLRVSIDGEGPAVSMTDRPAEELVV